MTCEKCGLEMRVERAEGEGLIVACRNPQCEACGRELRIVDVGTDFSPV